MRRWRARLAARNSEIIAIYTFRDGLIARVDFKK